MFRKIEENEEELQAEGKPEKIWDRILPGKIERFISDNTTLDQELCLLDQKFVMDDSKTVLEYVQEKAKAAGGSADIVHFVRLEVGEGIEVAEEDFALCEFVDVSKHDVQKLIRTGIELMQNS